MIKMADFLAGETVRLLDFAETQPRYRRMLLSLGLTRGVTVKVIRVAPLGCPVQIDVFGTMLALRKDEASAMIWERV